MFLILLPIVLIDSLVLVSMAVSNLPAKGKSIICS